MIPKHKIGSLVRVREGAAELHPHNKLFVGQTGVIIAYSEQREYPYEIRFLATGKEYVFNDDEVDGYGELEEPQDGCEQTQDR